jgi:hypothetical protein
MNYGKIAIVFFMIALAVPTFANRKAKVITESGKKWDVLFLNMSNDTIYLRAFKPNGDLFSIAGYKSKFKEIRFSDGSLLDFSLSNFPPVTKPDQSNEGAVASGSYSLPPSPQQTWQDTFPQTSQLNEEASQWEKSLSSQSPSGAQPGSTDQKATAPDTLTKRQEKKISPDTPAIDSKATVPEETKQAPLALEKPQTAGIAGSKIRRGPSLSLGIMSIASCAVSGVMYSLYRQDHAKEEQTFARLDNLMLKGSNSDDLISKNKAQHQDAQTKLTVSEILLGLGAALLVANIVFYF